MKRIHILLAATFLTGGMSLARADDAPAARQVIQEAIDRVLECMRDGTLSRNDRRQKVLDAVNPLFDYPLMAKLALGRTHWPRFSDAQKETFTDLFVRQLQETYLEKLDLHSDQTVRVVKAEAAKSRVHVLTVVENEGQSFEVVYKLRRTDTGWLVYDVDIEGVSVIASNRSQYEDFLKDKSADELLTAMREQLAQN
jgi:phospholipid transport system substrate-binding protein